MNFDVVVRFGDLDPYNHVNHARYFTYFESARVEVLEKMGFGMNEMMVAGVQLVLVEVRAVFHRSAQLHDRLQITTEVVEVARATTTWRQKVTRDGELLVSLDVKAAFTNSNGRPRRAPEGFAEAAEALG